jgi:uncharacterized protein (TIGR02466 family)
MSQYNDRWNVLPTFSTPLANTILNNVNTDEVIDCIDEYKFVTIPSAEDNSSENSKISTSRCVLDDFPSLKQQLTEVSGDYISNILLYDTQVRITTSWFTKLGKGGYSHLHNHTNSWFSGIFYFDDYDEDSGGIQFMTFQSGFEVMTKDTNIYNSTNWMFPPSKNMLVLFPSKLIHKILPHNSDKTRYSLAFNMVPAGVIGNGDSLLDMSVGGNERYYRV